MAAILFRGRWVKPLLCRGWGCWSYGACHVTETTVHNNICKTFDQWITLYDTVPFCTCCLHITLYRKFIVIGMIDSYQHDLNGAKRHSFNFNLLCVHWIRFTKACHLSGLLPGTSLTNTKKWHWLSLSLVKPLLKSGRWWMIASHGSMSLQ